MTGPGNILRMGVIGLGRSWRQRYQPALLTLRDRFQVVALCDQVQGQAHLEAKRLGCAAVAGPTELCEHPQVDAVLLPDRQWYGLWPLEVACRLGKPVFCAAPLEEDAHADRLQQLVQERGLPVLAALTPRFVPALVRLRDLLTTQLGAPRLLLCALTTPAGRRQAPLWPCSLAWLDGCGTLLQGEPVRLLATGLPGGEVANLLLDYGDGRAVQITRARGCGARRAWQVHVVAEQGSATVAQANRVRWSSSAGRFCQTLPRPESLGRILLTHFHDALQGGQRPRPSLADAYRVLRWLRLARRSWTEGGWVHLSA